MLLRLQVVRTSQVGVMAGLLVMGGTVEFGCLLAVAPLHSVALSRRGALRLARESKIPVVGRVPNH
jgi:hypothetical protein